MSALEWSAALALDLAAGEPPAAVHPVVLIGRAISALDRVAPRDRAAEAPFGVVLVGLPAVLAALAGAASGLVPSRLVRGPVSMWLTKTTFALRDLLRAGDRVEKALRCDDTAAARDRLTALVSRDISDLRADEAASAAIESLAENLCDSFVAPLLFYRIGGLPAALAYRAVNTADAMVGYRGSYERLGRAAARFDDVLNYVPARMSAFALIAGAAPPFATTGQRVMKLPRNLDQGVPPQLGLIHVLFLRQCERTMRTHRRLRLPAARQAGYQTSPLYGYDYSSTGKVRL